MAYEKQGFYSGQKLQASQLDAMEDGIIEAQELASQGAAGAANMEKGTGASATQQLPDGVADGFDFTGKNENATALDATLTGTIPYGATGDFASAFGGKCAAQGKRSHAEGTTTIAKGKYSHAEGDNSVTLGNDSHAEGYQTVTGPNATAQHAEGIRTKALGWAAHSEGSDTIAAGNNSHAGGSYTVAGHNDQTVIGRYNDNKGGNLFEVGNGTEEGRSNAFEVHTNGLVTVGNRVQQLPDKVADGFDFTGKNANATALDATLTGTIPYGATGDFASAFGGKSSAQGKRSHAEGTTTIAKGDYSHSEGNATVALGANAHAEGAITTAFGSTSHAEGQKTQAKGENSHAEGMSTITEGRGSHSEGFETKAIGNYSHAEGYGSQALHDESHASGYYTKTGMPMQTVCGAYNVGRDNTFFEIGNGHEYGPENAFEVYTDGTIGIKYQGKTYSLQKILEALNAFGSNSIID